MITDWLIHLTASFLSQRSTELDLRGERSDPYWVNVGIPQESPLSLVLFLFFTPQLFSILKEKHENATVTICTYVDHTYFEPCCTKNLWTGPRLLGFISLHPSTASCISRHHARNCLQTCQIYRKWLPIGERFWLLELNLCVSSVYGWTLTSVGMAMSNTLLNVWREECTAFRAYLDPHGDSPYISYGGYIFNAFSLVSHMHVAPGTFEALMAVLHLISTLVMSKNWPLSSTDVFCAYLVRFGAHRVTWWWRTYVLIPLISLNRDTPILSVAWHLKTEPPWSLQSWESVQRAMIGVLTWAITHTISWM